MCYRCNFFICVFTSFTIKSFFFSKCFVVLCFFLCLYFSKVFMSHLTIDFFFLPMCSCVALPHEHICNLFTWLFCTFHICFKIYVFKKIGFFVLLLFVPLEYVTDLYNYILFFSYCATTIISSFVFTRFFIKMSRFSKSQSFNNLFATCVVIHLIGSFSYHFVDISLVQF